MILPYLCLIFFLLSKWHQKQRLSNFFLSLAILLPLIFGIIPLSSKPLSYLEDHIKPNDLVDRQIEGIIVLGGFSVESQFKKKHNHLTFRPNAARLIAAIQWHKRWPKKPLVFSGFSEQLVKNQFNKDKKFFQLLDDLNINRDRVIIDKEGRNTFENAITCYNLILPSPGSHWILITDAAHMPRAIGSFRAAGWSGILGYPVNYQNTGIRNGQVWNIEIGNDLLRQAIKEYANLFIYWVTGKTAKLLPN